MALTASRTTAGFEPINNTSLKTVPPPTKYELTPATAFSKGDAVILTANKIAKAAASSTNIVGVMAESFTTSTNPAAATTYGRVFDHEDNVYLCTFSDHRDGTATGGSTTTLVDTGLSTSSDDVWNGALLYIYTGTNAGSLRTVTDYTGASDTLTVTKAFPAACDTTSQYILLGAGIASGGNINVGTVGVNLKDENTIDADATTASEAGPMVVMPMGPNAVDLIKELMLLVKFRKHIFSTP